jgi:asparagine synthase (glutamine-hydrolysing)
MRGKLPESVLTRKKEGFDIPAHKWFRGALRPMMEDVLSERAVRETGLFRPEAVSRVKQTHLRRRANLGYPLWGLLILFLWMKEWKIDSAAAR